VKLIFKKNIHFEGKFKFSRKDLKKYSKYTKTYKKNDEKNIKDDGIKNKLKM